jgi:hypothetical protein
MTEENSLLSELLSDCFELSQEFFKTGDVSRDTLLFVAARTRLIVEQAKTEMAAEDAQEAAQKPRRKTRGSRPTGQKKAAQKPAQGACVHCKGKLTGKQRRYCSKVCATKDWQSRNKDKQRAYSKAYYAKKKAA